MIHLISFTDGRMSRSQELLTGSAYKNGVDRVMPFHKTIISPSMTHLMSPTIHEHKGAGLYIWKPYIVFEYIDSLNDGDILIYADAGQTLVSSVRPVIEAMDQDIMMFSNGWNHMDWCKMDVAAAICPLSQRDTYCHSEKQAQASLIFFHVSPESRKFVKEWLLWCLMPGFCDNSPSVLPNVPTFQETRWDQSVLTCLQIKYGYKLHWFPTVTNYHQKADHPNDTYPAISDHHRKRNPGATGGTDSEW